MQNVHRPYIIFIIMILSLSNVKAQTSTMDIEDPITMDMTPLIKKNQVIESEKDVKFCQLNGDQFNFNVLSHKIKNMSYQLIARVEDNMPIDDGLQMFKSLSFFDVIWNYEHKNYNFSLALNNLLNMNDRFSEIEPNIEHRSLAAKELNFSYEPTFLIQASIQYRF